MLERSKETVQPQERKFEELASFTRDLAKELLRIRLNALSQRLEVEGGVKEFQIRAAPDEFSNSFLRRHLNERLLNLIFENNPICELRVTLIGDYSLSVANDTTGFGLSLVTSPSEYPFRPFVDPTWKPQPEGKSLVQKAALKYAEELSRDKTLVKEDVQNGHALLFAVESCAFTQRLPERTTR